MKSIIISDNTQLEISNDELDNDNFVDLILKGASDRVAMTVPLDDLLSACIQFESLRSMRAEQDKQCDC